MFRNGFAFENCLCVVIIPIVLDRLDTEMLAAHYIISHYSLDHIYMQP